MPPLRRFQHVRGLGRTIRLHHSSGECRYEPIGSKARADNALTHQPYRQFAEFGASLSNVDATMTSYDFRPLSGYDFEKLTRDLLQAEWNVRIESFASGRDKGIDLRY